MIFYRDVIRSRWPYPVAHDLEVTADGQGAGPEVNPTEENKDEEKKDGTKEEEEGGSPTHPAKTVRT